MLLFACFFFPFCFLLFSGRHRNIVDRFKKLSMNISNTCCFLYRTGRFKRGSCSNLSMYHINIAHKSSVFVFRQRSLTFKIIHYQFLLIGFVLRISAYDHVITHTNKKNILRKGDERAIQMKGTLTNALFIILTSTLAPFISQVS